MAKKLTTKERFLSNPHITLDEKRKKQLGITNAEMPAWNDNDLRPVNDPDIIQVELNVDEPVIDTGIVVPRRRSKAKANESHTDTK